MTSSVSSLPPLQALPLRDLTLRPHEHPRGLSFLSAASGLVCTHGRVYVIADDENHLAVFRDLRSPGTLHRVHAGELPRKAKPRKRRKADLETLLWLPPDRHAAGGLLVTLGSDSRDKVEGIALQPDGPAICMVTDADDPLHGARLLRATWPGARA